MADRFDGFANRFLCLHSIRAKRIEARFQALDFPSPIDLLAAEGRANHLGSWGLEGQPASFISLKSNKNCFS